MPSTRTHLHTEPQTLNNQPNSPMRIPSPSPPPLCHIHTHMTHPPCSLCCGEEGVPAHPHLARHHTATKHRKVKRYSLPTATAATATVIAAIAGVVVDVVVVNVVGVVAVAVVADDATRAAAATRPQALPPLLLPIGCPIRLQWAEGWRQAVAAHRCFEGQQSLAVSLWGLGRSLRGGQSVCMCVSVTKCDKRGRCTEFE